MPGSARLLPSLLVISSLAGGLGACGALKSAETGATPAEDVEGEDEPTAEKDGSSSSADGGAPKKDAEPDASNPLARPCTESVCAVEEVAKDLHGPVGVAVNDTHVFWIEVGSTIPNAGGYGQLIRLLKGKTCTDRSCFDVVDPLVLAGEVEGQNIYYAFLALGSSDICYTQSYNTSPGHSISCFSLSTLKKRSLAGGTGAAVSLWVGATDARWALGSYGGSNGSIRGRALDGGTAQTLAVGRDPTSVTGDGTSVYWTERADAGAPPGNVAALRPDGGVSTLASGRAGPTAVKVYGPHVYWLEYGSRLVMRMRADGTGAPEQIAETAANPFALVVDASGVYWASAGAAATGSEGSVSRAPLTPGGKTTAMLTNIPNVYDLAADGSAIYAAALGTQLGAGKILRMNKVY